MELLQQTQEAWSHESVLDRSTGKLRPLASGLTASSSSLNWKGVLVEHHRLDHYDSSEIMWVNHVILLHLGPSFEMEFENDGEIYRKELQPGQISFYPALTHCRHRSLQPTEFALISLSPEFVSIACCDMFALDSIKWARQTGISDSTLKVSVVLCSRKPLVAAPQVLCMPNHWRPAWQGTLPANMAGRRCAPSRPTVAYQPVSSSGPSNLFTSIWARMFLSKKWLEPLD